jgi:hypothetical protein
MDTWRNFADVRRVRLRLKYTSSGRGRAPSRTRIARQSDDLEQRWSTVWPLGLPSTVIRGASASALLRGADQSPWSSAWQLAGAGLGCAFAGSGLEWTVDEPSQFFGRWDRQDASEADELKANRAKTVYDL